MDVNYILKSRRKELGLTMKEVAKAVGVSEGTISRWESGDIQNMKRDKIMKLSQVLRIEPAVIMGWEGPKEKARVLKESTAVYGASKKGLSLTEHEEKQLKKYRALDEKGKDRVDNALDLEYEQLVQEGKTSGEKPA